jgi:hypothetical protein
MIRSGVFHATDLNRRAFLRDAYTNAPGRPPVLVAAVERLPIDHIRAMLEAGADPNRGLRAGLLAGADQKGVAYPLDAAVAAGRTEVVELLLARGARVDVRLPYGGYVLHGACHPSVPIEILGLLLTAGADPESTSDVGETPLLLVRREGGSGAKAWAGEARRLIEAAIAKRGERQLPVGVEVVSGPKPLVPTRDFGMKLRPSDEGVQECVVHAYRSSVEELSTALLDVVGGRLERDIARRPVLGGADMLFLFSLPKTGWTIAARPIRGPLRGVRGLVAQAERIAARVGVEGVAVVGDSARSFENRRPGAGKRAAADRWRPADEDFFRARGLLVPPLDLRVCGKHVTLVVRRVESRALGRVDLVVAREW